MSDFLDKKNLIASITRKDEIQDGYQIEIDLKLSSQANIIFPVFFTQRVWDRYVEFVPELTLQDKTGRLMDILNMFYTAVKFSKPESPIMTFIFLCEFHKQTWLPNEKRTSFSKNHREVTLKSVVGAMDFDDPTPVITIMMPDED